ncbi:DUF7716 domain-containing protein [Enterobacteriaceae bacterium TYF_5]|jgi:hypothetical protein
MLQKDHQYHLTDIILAMKQIELRDDNFCLYGEDDIEDKLKIGQQYFIADYPDVDDNDNEIYPDIVQMNHLVYLYSGQQFADVIDLALEQKPSATLDDLVNALNYYSEHDDFMDL